jgi:hypothetical protein
MLQGTCEDGKRFEAQLGVLVGTILYYHDGERVGRVQYSPQIGDCACSGQIYAGDVACAAPTIDGGSLPGDLALPFSDGKRPSVCMCSD